MNTLPLRASALRRGQTVLLAVLTLAVALLGALALPAERADAMEAVKCTGRPNSEDDPTVIMGATESRITFEASVAEGEVVSSLTLHLPEGTTFGTDDLAVTLLTGDDLMTRNELDYTEVVDGQDLTLDFSEPITQEGHLNILVYDVFFPTEGGEMQLEATYELDDGTEKDIEGIPSIPVEGISATESLSQWLEGQPWVQAWNSNRFLHLFFDPALLVTSFPVVLTGFFTSIAIVAVAFPLAIPMGLLLALMRISKLRLLRGIATTYVNIVRGTPLFLQIYVAFFGLPLAGIQIPNFVLGVTVMCMNRIDNSGVFTKSLDKIRTHFSMVDLAFSLSTFADIMEKASAHGNFTVRTDLTRNHTGKNCNFLGMEKDVLAIAGSEIQTPESSDQLRSHIMYAKIKSNFLAFIDNNAAHFSADLIHHLLDASRMNTSILNKTLKCNACNLLSDRIKTGNHNRLWCIINNNVNTGKRFQRTDITSFPSDNSAFHFI